VLPPAALLEGEVEDKIRVECMGNPSERCQAWFVFCALEAGDRRL
jgi:hypothetical protein